MVEMTEEFGGEVGSLDKPVSEALKRLASLKLLTRKGRLFELIRTPPSYQPKQKNWNEIKIPDSFRGKDALLLLSRHLDPVTLSKIPIWQRLGVGIRLKEPYQSELIREIRSIREDSKN